MSEQTISTLDILAKNPAIQLFAAGILLLCGAIFFIAIGYSIKIIKGLKDKGDIIDSVTIQKLAMALERFVGRLDALDQLGTEVGLLRASNESALTGFSDVISTMLTNTTQQHIDFVNAFNKYKTETDVRLEGIAKAVSTMTDDVKPLVEQLVTEISKGLAISKEQIDNIADTVSARVSDEIIQDMRNNTDKIIGIIKVTIQETITEQSQSQDNKSKEEK